MRVFVTGASGHIGSALVPELLGAGHQVVGLARSDSSAAKLAAAGARVHRGDLGDPDGLGQAATEADGVIHLAYQHEVMMTGDHAAAAAADLAVIRAFGDALAGTDKPLVITTGTAVLASAGLNRAVTEEDVLESGLRIESENAAIALADRGVRASAVRLPPIVHSSVDHVGVIPILVARARETGRSVYLGTGANLLPSGHTLDVATLFRLAVEQAPAGSRLHGVDDEGVPSRQIAEIIGRHLGLPVESIPAEEAVASLGFAGMLVSLDNPASSARTRELVGWKPVNPGLVEDLESGHYFATA